MKGYELRLSKRIDVLGKSQVYVRLTVTRTDRWSFKTGVFVRPEWFKPTETKSGCTWEIKLPKMGKYNMEEVTAAKRADAELQAYISRLTTVMQELSKRGEATKSNIEHAMMLTKDMTADNITHAEIVGVHMNCHI